MGGAAGCSGLVWGAQFPSPSALPLMWLSHGTSRLSQRSFNLVRSHLFTPPGLKHWLRRGRWSLKSPIIDLL